MPRLIFIDYVHNYRKCDEHYLVICCDFYKHMCLDVDLVFQVKELLSSENESLILVGVWLVVAIRMLSQ